MVPDDTSFALGIDFPITDFDASAVFDSSGVSFIGSDTIGLSGASSQSDKSLYNFDIPQFDIPSSGSFVGEPSPPLHHGRPSADNHLSTALEEADFLYDADFEFDVTGNIVDHGIRPRSSQVEQDAGTSAAAAPPVNPVQSLSQPGDEIPSITEDIGLLQDFVEQGVPEESVQSTEASEYIQEAQPRRKRAAARLLPRDATTLIPFSEIQRWEQDYARNMNDVRRAKEVRSRARHAKINAAFVLGNIGQTDISTDGRPLADSLRKLATDLVEQLTGIVADGNAHKRSHKRRASSRDSSSSFSENSKSRTRMHEDKEEFRGDLIENEEGYLGMLDDTVPSIELAREAITMIEDQSTQLPLPWSGSRAGSAHSGRLSRQASVLSARAAGNTGTRRADSLRMFDRRASRLPSMSPLVGHLSAQNTPGNLPRELQSNSQHNDFMFDIGGNLDTSPQGPGLDFQGFESFSPSAAGRNAEMTRESADFLAWIQDAVAAKDQETEDSDELPTKITFDELLPVQEHVRAVAAQGFLQLLTLANSSMIEVSQQAKDHGGNDLWWGPLDISLVG